MQEKDVNNVSFVVYIFSTFRTHQNN